MFVSSYPAIIVFHSGNYMRFHIMEIVIISFQWTYFWNYCEIISEPIPKRNIIYTVIFVYRKKYEK